MFQSVLKSSLYFNPLVLEKMLCSLTVKIDVRNEGHSEIDYQQFYDGAIIMNISHLIDKTEILMKTEDKTQKYANQR